MVLAGLLFWIAYTALMVIADDCKAKTQSIKVPMIRTKSRD